MFDSVEAFYQDQLSHPERAMTAHLPRLRALAEECDTVVEFGVKKGASSSALILGAAFHVESYDIKETREARELHRLADGKWTYHINDSRMAHFESCDMLFIDSLHTYAQLRAELSHHEQKVRKYIVLHDHITFGSIGADGETGRLSWQPQPGVAVPFEHLGIQPAINELLCIKQEWTISAQYMDSHGLLVLERR